MSVQKREKVIERGREGGGGLVETVDPFFIVGAAISGSAARVYRRSTWQRLPMPSNMQVLWTGMYCFVIILIIS